MTLLRSFVFIVTALTASGLAHAASQARPITHEDVWQMQRLAPPALSPDGNLAALLVTEPAYTLAETRADLWLIDVSGAATPRRLSQSNAPESAPTFSPDGLRIAFSAQRSGDKTPQIYLLDLAGGEASRITNLSTGARNPRFSPDGQSIAFVSSVHPGSRNDADNQRIDAEHDARKYNARVYTGFPIRNWDRWLDERQQRLFVQALDGGEARDLLAGSQLVQQPGYGGRFSDTGEELDFTWAPDSRSLVFAATANRNTAAFAWTHSDLYQVQLLGGEPKRLTGDGSLDSQDSFAQPSFAPNGGTLYALRTPHTQRIYNAARLSAWRWPSFAPAAGVAPSDGRPVDSYVVSVDGRTVYFTTEIDGLVRIFKAQPGQPESVLSTLERGVYSGLIGSQRGPQVLLALHDSASAPHELMRLDPGNGSQRALTAFNAGRSAALDLPEPEHFWSTNAAGTRIHNLLIRPTGFDPGKRYPLFVLIHGGPHTMWRDTFFVRWNYHLIAGDDKVVLLTNYTGSTGFGEAFAQAIQGDPLKGPADEINAAADAAIARFDFIDGERQCAGGASYGGHLANWLQGTTTRYRCLVSHAGLVNLEAQWGTSDVIYHREISAGGPPWGGNPIWTEQNPILLGGNFKTPTLVTIGELDYRVPLNNVIEYWSALQRMQVESRLVVFPDENHWILKGENSRFFYAELDAWLKRWLADGQAQPAPAATQ